MGKQQNTDRRSPFGANAKVSALESAKYHSLQIQLKIMPNTTEFHTITIVNETNKNREDKKESNSVPKQVEYATT